jgi:hypothetical protein
MSDIVSWLPHGMAFRIHKPKDFAEHIMPKYFKKIKYRSFQRQLHIYGFRQVKDKNSADNGAHYHKLFVRGKKDLCLQMTRERIKGMATDDCTDHHEPRAQEAFSGISSKFMKRNRMASSSYPSTAVPPALIQQVLEVTGSSSFDRNSGINNNEVGGNLSVAQQDLRDGEESFFAGRRFYFVEDYRDGDSSTKGAPTEHHVHCLKTPLPLNQDILQDICLHLRHDTSYKLRGGRPPPALDLLVMINPAA